MQVVFEKVLYRVVFFVFFYKFQNELRKDADVSHCGLMRYLEMLLSIGYGGGGVQWEVGIRGSCGCSACVGLSELMSAFMGM